MQLGSFTPALGVGGYIAVQQGLLAAKWVGRKFGRWMPASQSSLFLAFFDALRNSIAGVELTLGKFEFYTRSTKDLGVRPKPCPHCIEQGVRRRAMFEEVIKTYVGGCTPDVTQAEADCAFAGLFETAEEGTEALLAVKGTNSQAWKDAWFKLFPEVEVVYDLTFEQLLERYPSAAPTEEHIHALLLPKTRLPQCSTCGKTVPLDGALKYAGFWPGRESGIAVTPGSTWATVAGDLTEALFGAVGPTAEEKSIFPGEDALWAALAGPRTALSLDTEAVARSLARWACGREVLPRGSSPVGGKVEAIRGSEVAVAGHMVAVPGWIPAVTVGQRVRVGDELFVPMPRPEKPKQGEAPMAWLERMGQIGIDLAAGTYEYGLPLNEAGPAYVRTPDSSAVYPRSWLAPEARGETLIDSCRLSTARTEVLAFNRLYREGPRGLRLNMSALVRESNGVRISAQPRFPERKAAKTRQQQPKPVRAAAEGAIAEALAAALPPAAPAPAPEPVLPQAE